MSAPSSTRKLSYRWMVLAALLGTALARPARAQVTVSVVDDSGMPIPNGFLPANAQSTNPVKQDAFTYPVGTTYKYQCATAAGRPAALSQGVQPQFAIDPATVFRSSRSSATAALA